MAGLQLPVSQFSRDYTRPDLPTGDSEGATGTVSHSGFPDIAAAISGRWRGGEGMGLVGGEGGRRGGKVGRVRAGG